MKTLIACWLASALIMSAGAVGMILCIPIYLVTRNPLFGSGGDIVAVCAVASIVGLVGCFSFGAGFPEASE